jgi:hypothetical protein
MPVLRRSDCVQGAFELMTAWLACPTEDDPPDLLLETLRQRIEEHPSGDRLVGAVELTMGLTYLCGCLLTLRELDDGITAQQTIQDLALGLAERGTSESQN